jgi:hypothetical protein
LRKSEEVRASKNIVEPANVEELESVNDNDVEELLQSDDNRLTGDEIRALAEQRSRSEFASCHAEEKPQVRALCTEYLFNSFTAITQIMDQVADNGPHCEWNSKTRRVVLDMITYCRELQLHRKLRKN